MRLGRYAALAAIALVFCVALAGCGVGGNQKKLLSYFPSKEGFAWEYTGTDDYVQTRALTRSTRRHQVITASLAKPLRWRRMTRKNRKTNSLEFGAFRGAEAPEPAPPV